jgi:hypothetical protein
MKDFFRTLLCFVLLLTPIALDAGVSVTVVGGAPAAGGGYSSQDFTTYTEVDSGTSLTVTSTKITGVPISRAATDYVYKDFTVGYFSGDFTHRFIANISNSQDGWSKYGHWALSNAVEDMKDLEDGSRDGAAFFMRWEKNTNRYFCALWVWDDGVGTEDSSDGVFQPIASTDYYITVTRDDDAGTNGTGQYKAYICTTAYCTSGGNLQDTLSVDAGAGEQNDYRYLYGTVSYDTGNSGWETDGYTQSMEIKNSL